MPLAMKGQTADPDPKNTILYSKGKMYVKYGSDTNGSLRTSTTLYIKGSAEFSDGSGIIQLGRTELTGDFINGKDPAAVVPVSDPDYGEYLHLFRNPSTILDGGVVAFIGANNSQYIKRSSSLIEPKGAQKKIDYIAFPTIRIEKKTDNSYDPRLAGYLAVDSSAAIMVNYLSAPEDAANGILGTNRLSIEGGYDASNTAKINMGHALIKALAPNTYTAGYSQVKLDLYKYNASEDDGTFTPDHRAAGGANTLRVVHEGVTRNLLLGFTPPFQQLGGDYMFYHPVAVPNNTSFVSGQGMLVDPNIPMIGGKGYFMSMETSDYDYQIIDDRWAAVGINHANRARGGYLFSRKMMMEYFNGGTRQNLSRPAETNNYLKGFSRYTVRPTAASNPLASDDFGTRVGGWSGISTGWPDYGRDKVVYTDQETFRLDGVNVALTKGYNFLGNPFMTPISLNALVGIPYDGYITATTGKYAPTSAWSKGDVAGKDDTDNEFDISELFGTNVKASSYTFDDDHNVLNAKYWVINRALIDFHPDDQLFHMSIDYDYVSTDGTTHHTGGSVDPTHYLIAPMQMFCVQACRDFTLTLKPELRTFGMTKFNKSSNTDYLSDFFVVEAATSDGGNADRTAVVLRENALMASKDRYDVVKGMSKTYLQPSESEKVYPSQAVNTIYTLSSDGQSMLGNAVPFNVKELALYVTPTSVQQAMRLNFYNLENFTTVPNVWLIDRYENNKTVKLTPGYVYEYTAGPSDYAKYANDNRFILRFYDTGDDIIKEDAPITTHYNSSILYILGLTEDDMNSDVKIFDMQGRLIGNTKVKNYPSMEYFKPLSLGTYILKVSGKRKFYTKFVNLQN
jgi:hypothetical protein